MKHATTSSIALGVALGLAYATSTLGASADATHALIDVAATKLNGAGDQATRLPPIGNSGETFPTPYCALSYAQAVHPISRVQGMGIDHRSDPTPDASPSLEDFTTLVAQVQTGELAAISIQGYTPANSSEGVKVYIDWNQDGAFDEATEGYPIGFLLDSTGIDGKQVTAALRVPSSARTGETRMRVVKAFDQMANPWSCNEGGSASGQAEDYTLYVGGAQSEAIFCSRFEQGDDGSCSTPPPAGIVYSDPLNVAIPRSGLCINFLTGEMSPPSLPISHFCAAAGDPFLFGPGMQFYWGTDDNNAGVALTSTDRYLVLGPDDTIGPFSTFSRAAFGLPGMMLDYWDGMHGYLGVRFLNEQTGEINYGYVHMLTTHGSGFPAVIMDYAYDKSGAAITIP